MARFYANENFPFPVVERLRQLGHDVLTVQDAGNAGAAVTDVVVLNFAISEGRAVITLNRRHFIRLHNERPQHAGIVVCTVDPDFQAQGQRIHDVIAGYANLHGQLIRVNRPAS